MMLATISTKINDSVETGKSLLKDIGDKSNSLTHSAVDSIYNANLKTQVLVKEGIDKANNLTEISSQNLQLFFNSLWANWLTQHPLISFLIAHPIITLIIFITITLTIWGIIQMIPSLFTNLWLIIFKSPFSLIRAISQNNSSHNKQLRTEFLSDNEKDIFFEKVLSRLESINAEQKLILKQLSEMKKDS